MHTNAETVYFNGVPYRRYPNSTKRSERVYFRRSAYKKFGGQTGYLHRDVWEYHKGKIPKGYTIHHKNGYNNNTIADFELVTHKKHAQRHDWGNGKGQHEHLARIRSLTKQWHASKAGREWHSKHGKSTWKDRVSVSAVCTQCGGEYDTYFPT